MASLSAALSHTLFLFLICIACFCSAHKSAFAHEEERWPLAAPAQRRLRSVLLNQTDLRGRRLTGSFQLCALCTCCGGPRGLCLPSPAAMLSTATYPTGPSDSAPSPRRHATALGAISSTLLLLLLLSHYKLLPISICLVVSKLLNVVGMSIVNKGRDIAVMMFYNVMPLA
uniref:Uncharacterized protein n=1 Tax=Ananas comosus var. bracteatus TaxID=296719 RepID=A0A6V7PIF7_ANACO|nr:unnamed protein product [Ananas comosus var. bracteatus]